MDPFIFVIFGASGDLTERKLIPAIFDLFEDGYLKQEFVVLGVSRTSFSDAEFRNKVFFKSDFLDLSKKTKKIQKEFSKRLFYQPIDTNEESDYGKVKDKLTELDKKFKTKGNYVFYLSTPPSLYYKIPPFLAAHGLNEKDKGWRRLVIEKPFGYDAESARSLNKLLLEHFEEDQVYRIDHYLGKETVQNLLVTRFANGIFEPLWNRNYIHHIEITSAENFGVGNRGGYYDKSGALRDMLQNHLMQIVAHIAMEPPISADAKAIRNEKLKLFQSLRPIAEKDVPKYVIRGQYLGAKVDGKKVKGYREEKGVPDDSLTETYVAVKFFIDNWRWADVPFYIRTGKFLPTKVTEAVITFKSPPHALFMQSEEMRKKVNQLIIRIQPDEGILLKFGMKIPGAGFRVKNVDMDFHYSDLVEENVPQAYERLILDCINGDPTLYTRGDSVEESWKFVEPILNAWEKKGKKIKLFGYPAGTWGPDVANKLLEGDEYDWRNPCAHLTDEDHFCEL